MIHTGIHLKNVLLDLDGTLTDPFPGISRSILHALELQGLPAVPGAQLRSWIGPPLLGSFSGYFEQLGRGDARLALDHYRERFGSIGLFENAVYDGVPQLLKNLRLAGRRLYLATAKPRVYAKRIVEHFELEQHLSNTYGSELDGKRTDKVELLSHITELEGLDPADCIMVGDREHDVIAGRYHGMAAIGVLWGYGSEAELRDAGAQSLAASPVHLNELINELN